MHMVMSEIFQYSFRAKHIIPFALQLYELGTSALRSLIGKWRRRVVEVYTRQSWGVKPGLYMLLTIPLCWNTVKVSAPNFWKLLNGMMGYFKI